MQINPSTISLENLYYLRYSYYSVTLFNNGRNDIFLAQQG